MNTGDCGVCLSGGDGDTEFLTHGIRRARKPHVCCECSRPIAPGDRYEHAAGKTDGDLWTVETCLICAEIANTFYCDGRWYGGILWEEMTENAFPEFTTGCLDRLETAAAKAYLVERWQAWKGLR